MRARLHNRRDGFTLLEVAVSVAILGGVLGGMLVAQSRATLAFGVARDTLSGATLCASRVAALRAGVAGPGQGVFTAPSGFRWSVRRLDDLRPGAAGLEKYEVTVTPPSGERAAIALAVVWVFRNPEPEQETR